MQIKVRPGICTTKYKIMKQQTTNNVPDTDLQDITKKPNDSGTVHVDAFVRIHDPNTKQVYHEGRA